LINPVDLFLFVLWLLLLSLALIVIRIKVSDRNTIESKRRKLNNAQPQNALLTLEFAQSLLLTLFG